MRKGKRRDLQSCWKSEQQKFLSILHVAQVNNLVIKHNGGAVDSNKEE